MINIVLYEPEIPGNTGNIMRTCVATNTKLHLIEPLGFKLDESSIKRSGVNYIDKLEYTVYKNWDEFKEKNKGTYYFFTRYGHKPHDSFNYSNQEENIYFIFGKESNASRYIINYAKQSGKRFVNVNQGYSKCSVAKVSEKAAITADSSLYKAMTEQGIDVLLISQGNITLKGYDCGFIGAS